MDAAQQRLVERQLDDAFQRGQLDSAATLAVQYVSQAGEPDARNLLSRSPWFRARFLGARVLLASGQLSRSLKYLAEISPRLRDLDASLKCETQVLLAECLLRLNRSVESRQILADVDHRVTRRDPLLRLKGLRLQLWLGAVREASNELRACHRDLKRAGETTNDCLLWCDEGQAWEMVGDSKMARRAWDKAESILTHEHVNRSVGVDLCLLMGRFKHSRGELQQALDYFEKGREWASGESALIMELNLRRVQVLLDLNQHEKARAIYRQVTAGVNGHEPPEELVGLLGLVSLLTNDGGTDKWTERLAAGGEIRSRELAARIAIRQGELQEAMELYSAAWNENQSPSRRANIALAIGMLSLTCGQPSDARLWIARAIELAEELGLPEVAWRAYRSRGRLAAQQDGDENLARQDFELAVAIVEKQACKLELPAPYRLHRADVLAELLLGACRRGDVASAFRYQELRRGRLLMELWEGRSDQTRRIAGQGGAELDRINCTLRELDQRKKQESEEQKESTDVEIDALKTQREHILDQLLGSRKRERGSALPVIPDVGELQKRLAADTAFVAMCDMQDGLYAIVLRSAGPSRILSAANSQGILKTQIGNLQDAVHALIERYRCGFEFGEEERRTLDQHLDALGTGPLGTILRKTLAADGNLASPQRLIVVPDGSLTAVPMQAVRLEGRYLIETCCVVNQFSAAFHCRRQSPKWFRRTALAVSESPGELPLAEQESVRVLRTFWLRRHLRSDQAQKNVVRKYLKRARIAHFACHAEFKHDKPHEACLRLPGGESWYAAEWVDEPIDGLPLATLSACRSAETAELFPNESFGLVAGFFAGGARSVLAGLWPLADEETAPLMESFYRRRLNMDLAEALATTQRDAIESGCSPLFWAPLTLFGEATSLRPYPAWLQGVHRWFTGGRKSRA
jgi:tetratricopeptide (TPR) repeat protein